MNQLRFVPTLQVQVTHDHLHHPLLMVVEIMAEEAAVVDDPHQAEEEDKKI